MPDKINFIFIPGLGDDWLGFIRLTKLVASKKYQYSYQLNFKIHRMRWRQSHQRVVQAFKNFSQQIANSKYPVVLCGVSAGAAPALILAMMHPQRVKLVISFGGWLQSHYSLKLARNKPFRFFVEQFSKSYLNLSNNQQQQLVKKVISINSRRDWLIPASARQFPGKYQPTMISLPFYEHHGLTTIGLLSLFISSKNEKLLIKILGQEAQSTSS